MHGEEKMNDYPTEVERCDAIEAKHWKEKWLEAEQKREVLEKQIKRYRVAVKEYEQARRFLYESGDDPLAYSAESF